MTRAAGPDRPADQGQPGGSRNGSSRPRRSPQGRCSRETRADASRIREEARAEGRAIIAELREKAEEESDRIRERGEEQLAAEREQVIARGCVPSSVGWPPSWPSGSSASRSTTTRASAGSSTGSSTTSARRRHGGRPLMRGVSRAVAGEAARARVDELAADVGADELRRLAGELFSVVAPARGRAAAAPGRQPTRPSVLTSGPSCSAACSAARCRQRAAAVVEVLVRSPLVAGRGTSGRRRRASRRQVLFARRGAGRRPRRGRGRAVPVRSDPRARARAAVGPDRPVAARRAQAVAARRAAAAARSAGHRVPDRRGRPAPARAHHRPRRWRSTAGWRPPGASGSSPGSRTVVPLTDEQLSAAGRGPGGRARATRCTCNVEIDPDLVGGLTVRVGDELYRRQRRPPPRRGPPTDGRLSGRTAHQRPTDRARTDQGEQGPSMTELTHPSRRDPRRPRALRLELRARRGRQGRGGPGRRHR